MSSEGVPNPHRGHPGCREADITPGCVSLYTLLSTQANTQPAGRQHEEATTAAKAQTADCGAAQRVGGVTVSSEQNAATSQGSREVLRQGRVRNSPGRPALLRGTFLE